MRTSGHPTARPAPAAARILPGTLFLAVALLSASLPAGAGAQADTVRFRNPAGLSAPRGYSHLAIVPGGSTLLFVAGQVPLDSTGALVGGADVRAQAVQVFENLRRALAAGGATFRDVVKLNFYLLDVADLAIIREVRDRYVNTLAPPASTLVEVRALFRPEVRLEVEAVAVVRQP